MIFGVRPGGPLRQPVAIGASHPTIPVVVKSIEELGSELIVHLNIDAVRIDSGDPDAVEDLSGAANAVARFEAVSAVETGQSIDLAIDPAKLHFFHPQTHMAL